MKQFTDYIKREEYLSKLTNCRILCTYDITKLNQTKIKNLVKFHDKLILTTSDTTLLSSKSLSKENLKIDSKLIDQLLKNELETVVLALIVSNSMCGTDIKKAIYQKFGVLLSSGTLYPLLHKLEKNGLLKCEYGIKTKNYMLLDEEQVKNILNEHMHAKDFLSGFVQASMARGK